VSGVVFSPLACGILSKLNSPLPSCNCSPSPLTSSIAEALFERRVGSGCKAKSFLEVTTLQFSRLSFLCDHPPGIVGAVPAGLLFTHMTGSFPLFLVLCSFSAPLLMFDSPPLDMARQVLVPPLFYYARLQGTIPGNCSRGIKLIVFREFAYSRRFIQILTMFSSPPPRFLSVLWPVISSSS